jgi:hypothetical protein
VKEGFVFVRPPSVAGGTSGPVIGLPDRGALVDACATAALCADGPNLGRALAYSRFNLAYIPTGA